MIAGSGISEKPSAAMEESIEGLSLKVQSTPSRAPPACSNAETMARAVCENSRSAVISGPRSDRASTVRNSRIRRLLVSLVPRNTDITYQLSALGFQRPRDSLLQRRSLLRLASGVQDP